MVYRLTQLAEEQLIDTLVYGYQTFGPDKAEAYAQDLRQVFDLLSQNPALAPIRSGFTRAVRTHFHGKHMIAYLVSGNDVLIVAVLRQETDLYRQIDDALSREDVAL